MGAKGGHVRGILFWRKMNFMLASIGDNSDVGNIGKRFGNRTKNVTNDGDASQEVDGEAAMVLCTFNERLTR
jgi:hypothetical protein